MTSTLGKRLMFLGAMTALALLMVRLALVISLSEPRHIVTSGFEEESLFAIWKVLKGLSIYTDPHLIPYSASYFNWLFYQIYGTVIQFFLHLFSLSDEWIPTVGRLFTCAILMSACAINTHLLTRKDIFPNPLPLSLAFSLSVLVWLGPLIGFWAMTVRPDGLALFFDLMAATLFLILYPRKIMWAIILAALGCYCSWACKQINIVMPGAIGLFLLWERRFLPLALFSALMIGAYALTFFFANQTMLNTLFFVGTEVPFAFSTWTENAINFIKKSFPAWILLLLPIKFPKVENKAALLGYCGLLAWALTLLPASSKIGSADNYHFIALFFMVLIIAAKPYSNKAFSAAGVFFIAISSAAFFTGSLGGVIKQHQQNMALRQCMESAPTPLFVMSHYCSLPWMNRHSPTFMLAYNYWFDRSKGIEFEEDGIGGLINKRYFSALLLPSHMQNSFDESPLEGYQKQPGLCANYTIYIKKEHS